MKLINYIKLLLLMLLCLGGMPWQAIAQNPWKERYAQQASDNASRADTVFVATSAASEHTAEENYRITFAEAQEAIAQALMQQGMDAELRVVIPRREDAAIVSYREPVTMQIADLKADKSSHNWQATAYFSASGKTLAPVKLSGRYEEIVHIPVLKERVNNGELIAESNVELRTFGNNRLRGETIYSAAHLIGKTPKHSISALRPIRADEVITPPVIRKGESVTVLYKTPAMEIRNIGVAVENGAAGDIIKIRNTESQSVIQATVLAKGMAQISPANTTTTP